MKANMEIHCVFVVKSWLEVDPPLKPFTLCQSFIFSHYLTFGFTQITSKSLLNICVIHGNLPNALYKVSFHVQGSTKPPNTIRILIRTKEQVTWIHKYKLRDLIQYTSPVNPPSLFFSFLFLGQFLRFVKREIKCIEDIGTTKVKFFFLLFRNY